MLLVCMELILLYVMESSPTVDGQCPITGVHMEIAPQNNFRDEAYLVFSIDGAVQGGAPSIVTWKREDVVLSPTFSQNPIPGVDGASFYIGGDFPTSSACSNRNFRSAIQVNGRAPGNYSLTVDNDDGTSRSDSIVVQDSNPVTGLAVTQFNDVRLRAIWTAPVNTAPNNLVDYRVFINNEATSSNGTIVPAGTTTYSLPGNYTPGTTVTVHVRATTIHYWSVVTTSSPYQVAGVLAPVITPLSTTSSISLSLSQPSITSVSANQYTAVLTSRACSGNISERTETTSGNSITFSNLEEGIVYTVRIIASNTVYGYSSGSTSLLTRTQETAPNGSPEVSTASVTSTTLTLTWTEISCLERNGDIIYYIVRYGEGAKRNMIINTTSSSNTYTILDLKPYTDYTFTVAGGTRAGTGSPSTVGAARTHEDVPTAVLNLMDVTDLLSVTLTWKKPSSPNGVITGYTITYSINGSSIINASSNTTSFKISGLLPQTVVSGITVTARTGIGPGPRVSYYDVTTGLPRIENVMVTVLSDTSVRVSWDDPQLSSITYYEIIYSLVVNMTKQTLSILVDAPATSADITGLMSNVQISFQVVAFAELEGTVYGGEQSVINTVLVKTSIASAIEKENAVGIVISTIVVFFGTIVLYSIVLVLVIVLCYYNKHHGNSSNAQEMDMKDCKAYEQVNDQKSDQPYEVINY